MIELNSVAIVLIFEALAVLLLFFTIFLFFTKKRNVVGQVAANKLIDKLKRTAKGKAKTREESIAKHCELSPEVMQNLIEDISHKERILYQKIIQIFLNKDEGLLKKIDQHINNLSEPYFQILEKSSNKNISNGQRKTGNNDIEKLRQENQKLDDQLKLALQAMEKITGEYSQIFNGRQTELELNNSSKKMLTIYRDAHAKVKETFKPLKTEKH